MIGCFLVLAMKARGAPLTKTDGKIGDSKAFGDGTPNICRLVDKTMNMCESYFSKTYLKISGASSCRCIGIAGYVRYNRGSCTRFLGITLGPS